jgi:putative effector of murein hydrolase LrgA (UPF0299 family)
LKWHLIAISCIDLSIYSGSFISGHGNSITLPLSLSMQCITFHYKRTIVIPKLALGMVNKFIMRIAFMFIIFACSSDLSRPSLHVLIQLSGWIGSSVNYHFLLLTHIPYPKRITEWIKLSIETLIVELVFLWLPVGVMVLSYAIGGLWGSFLKVCLHWFCNVQKLSASCSSVFNNCLNLEYCREYSLVFVQRYAIIAVQ